MKKAIIFILIGMLVIGVIRFATFEDESVHYHANFKLVIDGQKWEFSQPIYMEETTSCSTANGNRPEDRVHLHNLDGGSVHVHDRGATWGHLLSNLGFVVSNQSLSTDRNQVYIDGVEGKRLTFILDGKPVSTIYNQRIERTSKLLIAYGKYELLDLDKFYKEIPDTAATLDHSFDPASCSGSLHVPDNFFKKFWFVLWH